ncbi:MAG: hypothetical protein CMI16_07385 [Opitutaceae bacterium]|nr:hypothetical protein [Opitutaceae bacterium]
MRLNVERFHTRKKRTLTVGDMSLKLQELHHNEPLDSTYAATEKPRPFTPTRVVFNPENTSRKRPKLKNTMSYGEAKKFLKGMIDRMPPDRVVAGATTCQMQTEASEAKLLSILEDVEHEIEQETGMMLSPCNSDL